MCVKEQSNFAGRDLTLIWHEGRELPIDLSISQVSAFCVNDKNEILIIKNKHGWGLPGGHPENGESIEETLRREIKEESDCLISDFELLGYVEVLDPQNDSIEGRHYVQLRFFCHLSKVGEFNGEFETTDRQFVSLEKIPEYVSWMSSSLTGKAQYESFMKILK